MKTRILFLLFAIFSTSMVYSYDFCAENKDGIMIYYNDISIDKFYKQAQVTYEYLGGTYRGCTEVYIPDEINGYKVTSIGYAAFYHCDDLKKVRLPSNLKTIEKQAFYLCANLVDIEFPGSMTEIQNKAFEYCIGLKNIRLTASYVGNNAFYGCSSLTDVAFSSGVSTID